MILDIKYAFRRLSGSPASTLIALLTLALGIGVNSSMFTVLNAIVLKQSAAFEADRLISIFSTTPQSENKPLSPANFKDIEGQDSSFEDVAAYAWNNFNLAEPGQPAEHVFGMNVSAEFFPLFEEVPELGRALTPEDDRDGAESVLVLSDGLWRRQFGADANIIGRILRVDGRPTRVVGVMPASFDNPICWGRVELWQPLAYNAKAWQVRAGGWLQAIGRLKPDRSIGQARSELTTLASRLSHDHPDTNSESGFRLELWNDVRVADVTRRMTWLCMGLSIFVLLIACANLANLQLAQAASRSHEYGMRMAIGASRWQLTRQFLVESLLLSLAGGTLGVLLGAWGTRLISSEIFIGDVVGFDLPVDARVLIFSLSAAVLTGIIFGTAPAWIATQTDVNTALRQGGRGSSGSRTQHRFRQALIVCELALTLMLLGGAAFFVTGMHRLMHRDMGWKPEGLVTAVITLPSNGKYATDQECQAFAGRLSSKLAGIPDIQTIAYSGALPTTGNWSFSPFAVDGRPAAPKGGEPNFYGNLVSPGYFATLGIRIKRGRDFTEADRAGNRLVTIINESMANKIWPGESPIGKRIGEVDSAHPDWREVVGVVNDIHTGVEVWGPAETPFQVYRPLAQSVSHTYCISLRSSAPLATLGTLLRRAVTKLDPDEPLSEFYTAPEAMRHIASSFTLVSQVLGIFAIVGLIISAVGLYGVIANLVSQRTSEIGIRMALGAQVRDILWLMMRQGMALVVVGIVIGFTCAIGLIRVLVSVLSSIPGGDLNALAAITAILGIASLMACWLPARRATRIEPIEALRVE